MNEIINERNKFRVWLRLISMQFNRGSDVLDLCYIFNCEAFFSIRVNEYRCRSAVGLIMFVFSTIL